MKMLQQPEKMRIKIEFFYRQLPVESVQMPNPTPSKRYDYLQLLYSSDISSYLQSAWKQCTCAIHIPGLKRQIEPAMGTPTLQSWPFMETDTKSTLCRNLRIHKEPLNLASRLLCILAHTSSLSHKSQMKHLPEASSAVLLAQWQLWFCSVLFQSLSRCSGMPLTGYPPTGQVVQGS